MRKSRQQSSLEAGLAEARRLIRQYERMVAQEEREREQEERERLDRLEAPVAIIDQTAQTVTSAMLLLAGYHRHKRGEWRRRR